MSALRQRMIEDLTLRNHSAKTIKIYVAAVAAFAKFAGRSPDLLGPEDVRRWQLHLVQEKKVSSSTLNVCVCALRFFYRVTLGKDWKPEQLPYAKTPQALPLILSQQELFEIVSSVRESKYRMAMMTAYAAGLRVSEVCTLRVEDIDSKRMLIHVRQAKGRKDRIVPLSANLLQMLRGYYREQRPVAWLFPGRSPERPLSTRMLERVVRRAGASMGKHITPHTLRHCFATHMLEQGVDVRAVQGLLGHAKLHTTARYTHVARREIKSIKSPLDVGIADTLSKEMISPPSEL